MIVKSIHLRENLHLISPTTHTPPQINSSSWLPCLRWWFPFRLAQTQVNFNIFFSSTKADDWSFYSFSCTCCEINLIQVLIGQNYLHFMYLKTSLVSVPHSVHSIQQLPSAYYVPGTVLGAGDTTVNTTKVQVLRNLYVNRWENQYILCRSKWSEGIQSRIGG